MKPSPNTTVLERLIAELSTVSEHFHIDHWSIFDPSEQWQVHAHLAAGHLSVDTEHGETRDGEPWTVIRSQRVVSLELIRSQRVVSLELACEDLLERIALAAPQEAVA